MSAPLCAARRAEYGESAAGADDVTDVRTGDGAIVEGSGDRDDGGDIRPARLESHSQRLTKMKPDRYTVTPSPSHSRRSLCLTVQCMK